VTAEIGTETTIGTGGETTMLRGTKQAATITEKKGMAAVGKVVERKTEYQEVRLASYQVISTLM
jgi:hypothetical protein